jgi:putative ABC transport system permease protein
MILDLSENHPEVKGTFKENDQDQQLQQQMAVTDTYMMFMTPIPPTNREIAVIAIRNIVIPVTISSIF